MDHQVCPYCKTTNYRNPSFKLMVSVCGHSLCLACVEVLCIRGSGLCPQCPTPLGRSNYRVQVFEDPMIDKDLTIRRRILRDYNKKEDDFATLKEYNDYLEEVEWIIYNLCNDIDVVNTNKRIEEYKRQNRDIIHRNRARLSRDQLELEEILRKERAQEEARRQELLELELEKKRKTHNKQNLIDELMHSAKDAADIVSEFAEKAEKLREEQKKTPPLNPGGQFSTGIQFGRSINQIFLPIPKEDEGPLYVYKPPSQLIGGPKPPSLSDIETGAFKEHIPSESNAEIAGGYHASLACQRAMQEAMHGLYFFNK